VGKPKGRKPPGRPIRRWENNIKTALREIGLGGTDCNDLSQDRDHWWAFVNTVMNLRFHKFLDILECLNDYRLLKRGSAPQS
jgi:hypothetical protein